MPLSASRRDMPKPRFGPAVVTRLGINHLDPEVRTEALLLADGDARRIMVVNAHHAIVR